MLLLLFVAGLVTVAFTVFAASVSFVADVADHHALRKRQVIFRKWGSRLAPPLITLRFHPVVAMCDVRFGDRPRDYRLFEKSPENEPTCV